MSFRVGYYDTTKDAPFELDIASPQLDATAPAILDSPIFWEIVQNCAAIDLGNLEDKVFLPTIDLGAWAGTLTNTATSGFTAVDLGTF